MPYFFAQNGQDVSAENIKPTADAFSPKMVKPYHLRIKIPTWYIFPPNAKMYRVRKENSQPAGDV